MSSGLTGCHCPRLSRTSKYFFDGAGGYDGSLRVAKDGPELANVLGARVVPDVLQRPGIAADPGLGQGTPLGVADQPADGQLGRDARRRRLPGRGRFGLGPIECLCRRVFGSGLVSAAALVRAAAMTRVAARAIFSFVNPISRRTSKARPDDAGHAPALTAQLLAVVNAIAARIVASTHGAGAGARGEAGCQVHAGQSRRPGRRPGGSAAT